MLSNGWPNIRTEGDNNTLDDIEREYELIIRTENERQDNEKRAIEAEIDEISLAASRADNRNFIKISNNGLAFKALLDPGTTLSLAGPKLAEEFEDKSPRQTHECAQQSAMLPVR